MKPNQLNTKNSKIVHRSLFYHPILDNKLKVKIPEFKLGISVRISKISIKAKMYMQKCKQKCIW